MEQADVERVVQEAVKQRRMVEVDYVRSDGAKTSRMMEPFEVGPGMRSRTGEPKFWGWCADHSRIEQRTLSNIIAMRITDEPYDPEAHRGAMLPKNARDSRQGKINWEEA